MELAWVTNARAWRVAVVGGERNGGASRLNTATGILSADSRVCGGWHMVACLFVLFVIICLRRTHELVVGNLRKYGGELAGVESGQERRGKAVGNLLKQSPGQRVMGEGRACGSCSPRLFAKKSKSTPKCQVCGEWGSEALRFGMQVRSSEVSESACQRSEAPST